ncbi:hypothetical protein KCU95_g16338, partial [Aureobasidium melanogenum]
MSNTRSTLSPPSYDSVRSSYISPYEATPSVNLLGPNQHPNAEKSQKSPSLSTSEALDDLNEIKGWPEQPRKLRDRSVLSILLVLAALAAKLHGQPIEHNGLGRDVKRTTQLGPTIFPIIFAAVAGISLKTLTRYYAERGMQLGVLELLLASHTVWGAIESRMLLRKFTVVGVHLFFLWSLSPLGGQGFLRIMTTRIDATTTLSLGLVYLLTGAILPNMTSSVFA